MVYSLTYSMSSFHLIKLFFHLFLTSAEKVLSPGQCMASHQLDVISVAMPALTSLLKLLLITLCYITPSLLLLGRIITESRLLVSVFVYVFIDLLARESHQSMKAPFVTHSPSYLQKLEYNLAHTVGK